MKKIQSYLLSLTENQLEQVETLFTRVNQGGPLYVSATVLNLTTMEDVGGEPIRFSVNDGNRSESLVVTTEAPWHPTSHQNHSSSEQRRWIDELCHFLVHECKILMLMKVHRPSLENTDYLLLRGADTIFLSDESLGQFSYNSYLMQSTAQIVLPGATYTQLLALALWLEEKKRIPCATRIIFLAGNQDCQRVLKGSQVPPREEIDLMVQEIWDLFEGHRRTYP